MKKKLLLIYEGSSYPACYYISEAQEELIENIFHVIEKDIDYVILDTDDIEDYSIR